MKNAMNLLLAGFGGQGILFSGKVVAYAGLADGKEVSWLPSYGPEMRGGTCNCSVCVSDEPIGSPLVVAPDVLVAMNLPSLDKFVNAVVPGGIIIIDSTLVEKQVERTDVKVFSIPAARLAEENGLKGLGNIVLIGCLFGASGFCTAEALDKGLLKSIPPRKTDLVEANRKALQIGMDLAKK